MKRKLVSMLLVLVMLVSLFPAMMASADNAVTYEDLIGWYIQELKDGGTAGTVTDKTVKIASGEGVGYNSNRALYVKWTSSDNSNDWLNLENLGIQSYTATDRYTVSFRIKQVNGNTTYPDILFGWTGTSDEGVNRLESKNTAVYTIGEADANNWQLVTATTTANAGRFFQLNIQKPSFEAYIDDFVVTKNDENTNLLVNGDFEATEEALDTTSLYYHEEKDFKKISSTETSDVPLAEKSIRVSTQEAYQDEKSLHINYISSNWNPYVNIIPLDADGNKITFTVGKSYKFSFYAKVLSGAATAKMQINTWGGSKLSDLTPTNAENGWKYYEVTGECTNAGIRPAIVLQGTAIVNMYIDNVYVENTTDAPGVNMLPDQVSTFEDPVAVWTPSYPEVSAPTTTKALKDWTTAKGGNTTPTTSTFVTAVGAENAYSGTNSMYVEFASSNYGQSWVGIKNTGTPFASLDANKSYTVSMYVKGNHLTNAALLMGYLYDDKNEDNATNNWQISRMTAVKPENEAKAADGWRKYTTTLYGPTTDFAINIQCATKVYIDDVSVVATDAPTVNLLNNPGFEELAWEPSYPTVTAPTTTKALEDWTANKGGSGTATANTVVTAVGEENAYSGDQSLYVEFAADSYGQNWLDIKNPGTMFASLDTTKAYTVSLYVKGNNLTNVGLKMGTNYDDKKEDNETNCWNISRMTPTKPEDETKAAEGWRKYTATLYGPTQEFVLAVQCNTKVYIDDISIVATDAPTVNLVANPGFEGVAWEPTYPTVTAPTTTKALEDWTANKGGSGTATTNTIVTAVGAESAYSGDQSLYVEFAADSYGQNWLDIKNTGTPFASLDGSKSYTVSMYVKGGNFGDVRLMMGYKYDDQKEDNETNNWNLKRVTATEPEDAAKAADGWRKYTVTLYGPTTDFAINVQAATKVYIDDVTVAATDAPTVNLLTNPGFEGSPVVLPDITETALNTDEWSVITGSVGASVYTAGVTAMEAQQGKKSLHITWTSSNGNEYVQLRPKMDVLTDNETYTLKAHVKRLSGNAAKLGSWKDWGGTGVGDTTEGEWEEMTITEACVGGPKLVQIILQGTAGVDMYIDNMVLTDSTGAVIWSEDFETATTGYETSAIKLFDEAMNEITALSSDLNGKTLTGAVAVTNYDKADLTGQLLLALYDGYQLEELIMSEVQSISTTASGSTIVTVEFELPDYKDSYTMKAFIWDSIEGMNPLSRKVVEF